MRVAVLTPLAPVRSGIASYSAMLLPALARRASVTAVVDQEEWVTAEGCDTIRIEEYRERRGEFDATISQLGNNPWHEFIYREAMERATVVVLHDVVLHHLIVEMTLARGNADAYVEALRRNHGSPGAAFARGRSAGLHAEAGNFLFPASVEIANRSRAVVVHNEWAARRLRDDGVSAAIHVIPHPMRVDSGPDPRSRLKTRTALGFGDGDRVVGLFGFVTSAKRPEVVFEAFAKASKADARLRLLVVGESAPNVDLEGLGSRFGVARDRWRAPGYAGDDDFDAYLRATDCIVNLRYPTAGETSGALLRILAAGRPVAVSAYAQFAEYPADIVTGIPFGRDEVEHVVEFMLRAASTGAARQRDWVRANADLERAADRYMRTVADQAPRTPVAPIEGTIPLFPALALESIDGRREAGMIRIVFRVRNRGGSAIRAATFGEPEYRIIARVLGRGAQAADRWLALPRDLGVGDAATLEIAFRPTAGPYRVELTHACEGIPVANDVPFAVQEIRVDVA